MKNPYPKSIKGVVPVGRQIPTNLIWSARNPNGLPMSLRMTLVFHGPASWFFTSGVRRISQVSSVWLATAPGWASSSGHSSSHRHPEYLVRPCLFRSLQVVVS